jgi:hypothetical protein
MTEQKHSEATREVQDRITRVIQASRTARRVRACLLATRDRDHALGLLKETVRSAGDVPLYHFTVAARRRFQSRDLRWETVGQGPNDTFTLLDEAQRLRGGGVVVLEDSTAFLRDEGGDQRVRMLLAQLLSTETQNDGLVLAFVEPPEAGDRLPSILQDQFVRLDIPYPRAPELTAIATQEIALLAHRTGTAMAAEEIRSQADRLATELVGLTRSAARDALWDALAASPKDGEGAYRRLASRKAEQLSRDLAMNILDTTGAEEPTGLENLVDYLRVTQDRMRISGPQRARGVLLIGPPGTGKTMLARAIGRLVKLPVVEFRISALMNSLLGETERRFAQAFQTLEAMGPQRGVHRRDRKGVRRLVGTGWRHDDALYRGAAVVALGQPPPELHRRHVQQPAADGRGGVDDDAVGAVRCRILRGRARIRGTAEHARELAWRKHRESGRSGRRTRRAHAKVLRGGSALGVQAGPEPCSV